MRLINKKTGIVAHEYSCDPRQLRELCFANIECLLQIALADSDEHIRQLGGEEVLIDLMERYEQLANKMLRREARKENESKI